MTRLLTATDVARIVAAKGLRATFDELAAVIEADLRRWPQFEKTARLASHSSVGVIELMPVADASRYGFKYVNGHPGNPALGLPTVMAFGALADVATGLPLLVADLTLATALRTAATSALAARVLARSDARSMALVGNGAQSEFQALAFHLLLGIDEVRLYDPDALATARLRRHLDAVAPALRHLRCASAQEALAGADIVTTLTADKHRATIVAPSMLEPGMHFNAVGGDCPGKTEFDPAVLRTARVFVEYEAQTRIEGESQQMPSGYPVTELWQVLTHTTCGRQHRDEITLFDSVGFALEDFSALAWLAAAAAEAGVGHELDLIPTLDDPKNLFGLLEAAGAAAGPLLQRHQERK